LQLIDSEIHLQETSAAHLEATEGNNVINMAALQLGL